MKYETQMKPRGERSVITEREGAAIRQDHRANTKPAKSRKACISVAELREPEEWSAGRTVVVALVAALFMYAFMFLAAAY